MKQKIYKQVKTKDRSYLSDGDYYEGVYIDEEIEKMLKENAGYEVEEVVGGGNGVFLVTLRLKPTVQRSN